MLGTGQHVRKTKERDSFDSWHPIKNTCCRVGSASFYASRDGTEMAVEQFDLPVWMPDRGIL